jgi:hypothetical protein
MANIKVIGATYGSKAHAIDVTSIVQKYADQGAVSITADNDTFLDPAPGDTKHCMIALEKGGKFYGAAMEEHQGVLLNGPSNFYFWEPNVRQPAPQKGEIEVIVAIYGAIFYDNFGPEALDCQPYSYDVTKRVYELLQSGSHSFNADNKTMQVDPDTGHTKHFGGLFRYKSTGQIHAVALEEGQEVSL